LRIKQFATLDVRLPDACPNFGRTPDKVHGETRARLGPAVAQTTGRATLRHMAIEYRLGRDDDLAGCLELEWTRSRDDLAWHVAGDLLYVAVDGAAVVGLARLESFWKPMPYLALIVVRDDARGNGVGSELLAFMRADLRARGYRTLLSSTTEGEEGPRRWHLRNGFADVGVLHSLNADGADEVFYTLALSHSAAHETDAGGPFVGHLSAALFEATPRVV
jgi:L-amino acid N-acyltransferase YncA